MLKGAVEGLLASRGGTGAWPRPRAPGEKGVPLGLHPLRKCWTTLVGSF